jgi:PIN domain nuclease of toxin-antitoxin system
MLNLDTHMLVALAEGDISPDELACTVNEELAISDIVQWELSMLVRKNRLTIDFDSPEFRAWRRHLTVLPITWEIAHQSTLLDFSSDPADEIIAATSVVENIPLLTRDRRIRMSRVVPLALK